MARLSDLPTEIIEMIVELASPEDIESQTATCKTVYYAATRIVERHRALKKKHGVRRFSHPGPPGTSEPRQEVTQFLDEVLLEPRLAFYVRELSLDGLERRFMRHWCYKEEFLSRLRKAAVKPKEWTLGIWLQNIETVSEEPIFAMLLLLLSNLTTLKLKDIPFRRGSMYLRVLYCTVRRQIENAPLSRLRHVQASQIHLLGLLAALPTVTSVHGLGITANEYHGWDQVQLPPNPNVRDLVFTECSINPKCLFNFLCGFHALRSFTYDCNHASEEPRRNFDFAWVRGGLLACAKSTLESLTLLSHNKDHHWMEEIRSFSSLRNLHTESQILFTESRRHQGSLVLALPPKLETLKLECSGQDDEIGIARLIFFLARLKYRHVPALRKLEIVTRNGIEDLDSSKSLFGNTYRISTSWISLPPEHYTHEIVAQFCKEHGIELAVTAFEQKEIESYQL